MRTRFLPPAGTMVRLVGLGFGIAMAAAGCDDIHSGQVSDDSGPPKVSKVVVQDVGTSGGRGLATDLLLMGDQRACDDTHPCDAPTQCGLLYGQPINDAKCHDQHAVNEVAPITGDAGGTGGPQIRVVLNKVVDLSVDQVVMDPKTMMPVLDVNGRPTFTLAPGIVSLVDAAGKEIKTKQYYDLIGSPTTTSDAILAPYGPALVMKTSAPLKPNTKYTIKLDTSKVKDRAGKMLVGQATYDFTTEGAFVLQPWNCPSGNCTGNNGHTVDYPNNNPDVYNPNGAGDKQIVHPNDFFQIQVNTDADFSKAKVTVKNGAGMEFKTESFTDQGADPTMCTGDPQGGSARVFDVVPASMAGKPTDLPAGDYTLTITGITSADGKLTLPDYKASFTVGTVKADPMKSDPAKHLDNDLMKPLLVDLPDFGGYAVDNVLLPEQCMPAMPDMAGMKSGDMTMSSGADGGNSGDMSGGAVDGANAG